MARVFTIAEGLENMGALKTGGQGSVYKGRRMGQIISAVKLLPTPIYSESADDKNFIDFQNEVEKLKKVNEQPNPNVVKILNSGISESGSFPFIEMEFIDGPDLEELLKPPHDPVFTIRETIKLAEQLSNALAHCHRVGVKHGDVKSNNVKFNVHTGNYVLLDFGLAVMSDEQRRTSLRHAGAIEFMAPEQNDGSMLFETDVYSYGIILYELLAGRVPFPLRDKGETARNTVMVAHLETPPPDLLVLRKQNIPDSWSNEKKEYEMNVPHWLLSLIYRCLEKKPEARFKNGMELYDFVILNSNISVTSNSGKTTDNYVNALQQQNEKLLQERDELQKILVQYQDAYGKKEREIETLREEMVRRETEARNNLTSYTSNHPSQKRSSRIPMALLLIVILGFGAFTAYSLFFKDRSGKQTATQRIKPDTAVKAEPQVESKKVIAQYKVSADRAYFYNQPDESTKRGAYLVSADEETVNALDDRNDFIYTEFTNSKGQISKGWLRKQDLMTLEEWTRSRSEKQKLPPQEVLAELQQAKELLQQNNIDAALVIYKKLSDEKIPEAMFYYGDLALRSKNENIDCGTAIDLVKQASDKSYVEAKRTLGFLYLFAENPQMLKVSNYDRCMYEKNVTEGTKLLMEAVLSGDTTARRILNLHQSLNKGDGTNQ